MYVTSKEMIYAARKGGYAVPAFNAENLDPPPKDLSPPHRAASLPGLVIKCDSRCPP